jgi:hypothetical protein
MHRYITEKNELEINLKTHQYQSAAIPKFISNNFLLQARYIKYRACTYQILILGPRSVSVQIRLVVLRLDLFVIRFVRLAGTERKIPLVGWC